MTEAPVATGYLRFIGGIAPVNAVGWKGPWPPPERMVAMLAPDGEPVWAPAGTFPVEMLDAYEHQEYEQTSASQLTDEQAAEMTHVVRGAEYKPVT